MAATKASQRTALRNAVLESATFHEISEQVRMRADRLRQSAPVTEPQLVRLVDAELAKFFGTGE